ncbi:Galactarate dehydratase [Xylanimonas cellulosilytica DSM 15894]|uniref:Galactarate dehydratase n=1 Tax=Xylanimonas cellulosilytica (strain DSM 15894 / JCM 12276 / CECT 5975 / KCTC 9989 / LMG 20990 / NBRC 107835 / XIL07) TaxID=446471 RepID=D1BWK3_XYLCX|nr:altronate dehydratase family protein [Xylanimonas cellulosilytica]ACZ31548.1 Galactarate dehydratase [Xylanimonas cellulosilytica DSM 15894]
MLLLLHPDDDVAVATRDLAAGETLDAGARTITTTGPVPRGHKVAVADLPPGAPVHKYGQVIGVATAPLAAGEHVHAHNLGFEAGHRDHQLGGTHTELAVPAGPRPTFQGYRRADGRVGTRNYVAILTSVNCSATTARMIAAQFGPQALAGYPNVDGVIALTHQSGCGLVPSSEGGQILLRTLRGYAAHPNIAGVLVLGLGCEMVLTEQLTTRSGTGAFLGMPGVGTPPPPADPVLADIPADTVVESLTIQESGGVRAAVTAGVAAVERMLAVVDTRRREICDVADLVLALNCGGSDGYSGLTANPALGWASDRLVAYGATSALAETPEVFGAEHLLTRRAVTPQVAQRLLDRIDWWQDYTRAGGGSMDNNPSPGNKAGGLTTILEKSLGAVAKGGQADLAAVYEYAERMAPRGGFVFMDTPGYDPVSVTGLVAGGSNVVVFTTGRGSVFGCRPTPSIKVATNTPMYRAMSDDMDVDAGRIVEGEATVEQVGQEILDLILRVASGEPTVSEDLQIAGVTIGAEEFVPWHVGAVT